MPPSSISVEAIITLLTEQEILPESEKIEAESDLFALGLDSLATMQLLLHMEKQFFVSIPQEQISHKNLSTPANLAAWMQRLVG
jgi:acyl carrier protein